MVRLEDYHPIPEDTDQFPFRFIEHCGAVILKAGDFGLEVGITNPEDIALKVEIRRQFSHSGGHATEVIFQQIDNSDLASYIHSRLRKQLSVDEGSEEAFIESNAVDKLANNAPIINLVNGIILDAINAQASDIHIERGKHSAQVRYRLDGVLTKVRDLPANIYTSVTARVKIMSGLNIMEQRRPQDGRLSVSLDAHALDIRVSSVPTAHGESLVLRILNLHSTPRAIETIGFSHSQLNLLSDKIRHPQGLILVTGPTGSGKTTTLNALVSRINDGLKKIITIEDPVEFNIDGVNQIQTHDEIGLTFSETLKRILRQDPNVIMVGEIRDEETAQLAMRAAMTGHLVLSSLHTTNAMASIQRLLDMSIQSYLLAGVLETVVAQRLVRKLCDHCKTPVTDEAKISDFRAEWTRVYRTLPSESVNIFSHVGCPQCRDSGYKGRTVISEIIDVDEELIQLIEKQADQSSYSEYLRKHSFISLHADALRQVAEGVTSMEELRRLRTEVL